MIRVRETIATARPPEEVYALLAHPERRDEHESWSGLARSGDAYNGVLHVAAGPITVDLDCRFEVAESEGENAVRLRGTGTSPRVAFTFEAQLAVEAADAGSRVAVDGNVAVSGPLAGLGQRRLAEQARRLLTAYVSA